MLKRREAPIQRSEARSMPCGHTSWNARAGAMQAAALYAEAAAKTSSAPERDFLAMKAARLRERS